MRHRARASASLAILWEQTLKWAALGAVVGAVAGLGAIALHELVQLGTALLLGGLAGYQPAAVVADGGDGHPAGQVGRRWALPLLASAGALMGALLVRCLAPESLGHGLDAAIAAAHNDPRGTRGRVALAKLVGSALTLGSGGSGGTEGPAGQMGVALGAVVSRLLRLSDRDAQVLVTAGLGAAVGAIFRAPLAGAFLGPEVLYRHDAATRALGPSLVASIVAHAEFGAVFGYGPMFGGQAVSPLHGLSDMGPFAALGAALGLLGRLYVHLFLTTGGWFSRRRLPAVLRPAVGAFAVGTLGVLLPQVLSTGYGNVQALLDRQLLLATPIWVLLALPFAKMLATSLSLGSGGSGGVFGPGMVIGAASGAGCWRLLEACGLAPHSPVSFVLAGVAACLGSITNSPMAATIMVAEVGGGIGMVPPVAVAVLVAVLVVGDATIYPSQPLYRDDTEPA